ncbi:MAG: PTS transporter subunit EIIA [Candidatus Cloacimonetes bacterium]|jgi:nitrogen PTS system EIIA component|nr:PTS transporter subunit EIIA [Candidatus Cloacimonadota bacterium]MBT6994882.1 PTS transporter subunit EIIA [Candidatus Cloacimonadota bacterium]MBT7468997.1 PTS transporter subunit EIIA [Candidatus Cloacimonadota bacterium]
MENNLLTLKKAASLLKVTDSVISEMINSGVFQITTERGVKKIKKEEIDDWLANLKESELEDLALKKSIKRFGDYFCKTNILTKFDANNKYEAIGEMAKFTKQQKIVKDHRWLYKVLIAREELISTAIGDGVALLHPRQIRTTKIEKPTILLGRSTTAIEFDAIDEKPVDLFFVLLLHNDAQHLFAISYLSRLLRDRKIIEKIRKAKTNKDIHALLIQKNKK